MITLLLLASSLVERWPASVAHPFRQTARLGLGFSYRYDGPEGLAVTRDERAFPEFEAIEYVVRFRNTGDVTLPAVSAIQAVDLQFGAAVLEGVSVVSAGMGMSNDVFPPETFALRRRLFGLLTPMNGRVTLTRATDLPFWFVDNPKLQAGVFVALGGGGQWEASVEADYEKGVLTLRGAVPGAEVRLRPGEEISGPTVLLGAYRGPLWAGSNRLRRLLREQYRPAAADFKEDSLPAAASSGGLRIDLETVRRFPAFRLSDHALDPHVVRFLFHGLNYFLPGNYPYASFAAPADRNRPLPDIAFQSFFGGNFVLTRLDQWPPALRAQAKKHVAVYREIQRYLVEDYYPLTPQPRDLDAWEAWQFHDPKADEGFVQAFRLQSEEGFRQFRLQGLTAAAPYRFRDPYTGEEVRLTGAQALEEGVGFQLPAMSSKVLVYERADRLKATRPAGNSR